MTTFESLCPSCQRIIKPETLANDLDYPAKLVLIHETCDLCAGVLERERFAYNGYTGIIWVEKVFVVEGGKVEEALLIVPEPWKMSGTGQPYHQSGMTKRTRYLQRIEGTLYVSAA